MENSVVGQVKESLGFDQIGEEFLKGGLSRIRLRALGDNLILITPGEGESMGVLVKLNKEWFDSLFSNIRPWSISCVASHKNTWVRCYGLPLPFWNKECFEEVLGGTYFVITIDNSTLLWENLEFARLHVRASYTSKPRMMRSIRINDKICNILIEEEAPAYSEGMYGVNDYGFESSDNASFSGTYVEETILSSKSCEEELHSGLREEFRSRGRKREERRRNGVCRD